jgi:hypothetical protein
MRRNDAIDDRSRQGTTIPALHEHEALTGEGYRL